MPLPELMAPLAAPLLPVPPSVHIHGTGSTCLRRRSPDHPQSTPCEPGRCRQPPDQHPQGGWPLCHGYLVGDQSTECCEDGIVLNHSKLEHTKSWIDSGIVAVTIPTRTVSDNTSPNSFFKASSCSSHLSHTTRFNSLNFGGRATASTRSNGSCHGFFCCSSCTVVAKP